VGRIVAVGPKVRSFTPGDRVLGGLNPRPSGFGSAWGGDAEYVLAGDHEAMAAALARVIDDAGLRSRLVQCGRARASSFTWDSAATSMVELYMKAARERGAR